MRLLDEIFASTPVGNAYSDADLWAELHHIARNLANSYAVRARAIRKMDELTGESESAGQNDITCVDVYVRNLWDDLEIEPFTGRPDA